MSNIFRETGLSELTNMRNLLGLNVEPRTNNDIHCGKSESANILVLHVHHKIFRNTENLIHWEVYETHMNHLYDINPLITLV